MRAARYSVLLVLAIVFSAAAVSLGATDNPIVTIQLKDAALDETAAKLAAESKTHVVADPDVRGAVTLSLKSISLEKALDVICTNSGLAWYMVKIDLPADAEPDAREIARVVRVLATMGPTTFIAEQPAGTPLGQIERSGASPAAGSPVEVKDLTTVYLLTSADLKTPPKPPTRVDRMMDMQKESMQLMMTMTPEEMAEIMQRGMDMFMKMDPQQKAAMMNQSLNAITKMDPAKMRSMANEMQAMAKDIPPETIENLMKVWGWDPNNPPPPPPGG